MRLTYDHVRAEGLVKLYGRTRALAGVDLELHPGVTVIEGPNGSGKSTLLQILALMARPTDGALRFGPHDARRHRHVLRRSIGVLAHASFLYPDLSGAENLRFFGGLAGVEDARVDTLRERFGIGRFGERPVRTYSRGQAQRVALARALLAQPRTLLLDEPSTGLDVAGVRRLREAIAHERDRGAIVVVITHDRAFAKALDATRVKLARGRRA